MEEDLELLGACRRDIAVFRGAFTELLESCTVDDEPYEQEEETVYGGCYGAWPPSRNLGVHAALPRLRPPASGVLLSLVLRPRPDSV
jgi:hypothetical protein